MAAERRSKVTMKIPRPLYEKIGRLIEDSGYNSVTDFICYVLRDIIGSHGAVNGGPYSMDVAPTTLKLLNIQIPANFEGTSVV